MKKKYAYITILILSLTVYFVYEWTRPRPVDWSESYSGFDKRPYGCFIIRDLLPYLFPQKPVNYRNKPVFTATKDDPAFQNTIFINAKFTPDSLEAAKLFEQVKNGNTIFIAAKAINGDLADILNIKTGFSDHITALTKDSVGLNFVNPSLHRSNGWYYPRAVGRYYFSNFDTLNTVVLGTNSDDNANYIKIKKGKGAFFIHTIPHVFTNYFMRNREKAGYAFKALSYLPVAPTVWDEYYKIGRSINRSPLRYIVSQRNLKRAWITALAGLFLFLIFRAKRRQRIIPNLESPQNTTLKFATTIGRLYHQNSNHKNIASKRITYLMEYIREKLNLDTRQPDEVFIRHVSQRSGVDIKTVESLFSRISAVRDKATLSSNELWQLNHQIETFYKASLR